MCQTNSVSYWQALILKMYDFTKYLWKNLMNEEK